MAQPDVRAVLTLEDDSTITATIPAKVPKWDGEISITVASADGRYWMKSSSRVQWWTGQWASELKIFVLTPTHFAIACNMHDTQADTHGKGDGTPTPVWVVTLNARFPIFDVRPCCTEIRGCWVTSMSAFKNGKYIVCCLHYPHNHGYDKRTFLECYKVLYHLPDVTDVPLLRIRWRAEFPPVPNSFPFTERNIVLHTNNGNVSFDIMAGTEKELEGVAVSSDGLDFDGEMPACCFWRAAPVEGWLERNERTCGMSSIDTVRVKAAIAKCT